MPTAPAAPKPLPADADGPGAPAKRPLGNETLNPWNIDQQATTRLQDAIDALPAGIEFWDADDRLILSNRELARLYPAIAHLFRPGVSWEAIVRANHAAGSLAVAARELDDYIERRRRERWSAGTVAMHATADGRWIRTSESPLRGGGLVGVRFDVTEQQVQRLAAEAASQRLSDAIEAIPEGFALYDAEDRLVACNEHYRELYKESAPAMTLGARFEDVVRFGLDRGQYPQAVGREQEWLAERMQVHRNPGEPRIQQLSGDRWLRIDERKTRDGGIAGVRTDVTELIRREQELVRLNQRLDEAMARLEELSETDALTSVANRRRFDRVLADEWSRLSRHGAPLTLLMIDVDHFKLYNDSYGHQAGDDCLQKVAQALTTCARRPTDLVARYGGEEFALLLPHTDAAQAAALAERCLGAIDAAAIPHRASPLGPHVTVSIGLAVVTSAPAGQQHALVHAADQALYRAKAAGRHCFET